MHELLVGLHFAWEIYQKQSKIEGCCKFLIQELLSRLFIKIEKKPPNQSKRVRYGDYLQ